LKNGIILKVLQKTESLHLMITESPNATI